MKANELMIGDWVKMYNGKDEYLDDTRVDINVFYIICQDGQNVLRLEPIPITAEILERNGFKKCNGCDQWTLYEPSLYCILWSADESYLEITHYTSLTGEFKRMGIHYVHELQHALRLCSIEHEIKL